MAIIGGAILSATAFTAGQAIYDQFRSSDNERHNRAMEKLSEDNNKWNQNRLQTLDYINAQMKLTQDAKEDFDSIDDALREYNELYPKDQVIIPPKPQLSDYLPEKINHDYLMIIISTALSGFIVYKLL